jgi:hypothetical protein
MGMLKLDQSANFSGTGAGDAIDLAALCNAAGRHRQTLEARTLGSLDQIAAMQ